MRLTLKGWGLRAPHNLRLGENCCWALPRPFHSRPHGFKFSRGTRMDAIQRMFLCH